MGYQPQDGITDWANRAMDLWGKAAPIAAIGVNVLDDPYLPQVSCEIARLTKASSGYHPGPRCATPKTAGRGAGVGLRYVVNPLRVYVWHRQYPWAIPLASAAILTGLFYAGYVTGKRKGK